MTTEQTSARVSKIAGRILELRLSAEDKADFEIRYGFKWAAIRSVAGSVLTQTQNRSKRIPKKARG